MTDWAWHVHHGEYLLEPLTEPIEVRIAYIRANKPAHEIETRLRLLRPVQHPERLPAAYQEAYRAKQEADRAWHEAYRAWQEAYRAWQEAYRAKQEADRAWQEAYRAWQEAYRVWQEAYRAWQEAYIAHLPEIEALHREECPSPPCTWDGKTLVFPEPEREKQGGG